MLIWISDSWLHSDGSSACKKEKGSWDLYKLSLKNIFGMGPEFVGKTKDSNTKDTPNLSSKAVEEPVDGTQTVDATHEG